MLISWPINPETGDIYTSPYGTTWTFNGCGWISGCCSSFCNPYAGIIFKLMFSESFFIYLPSEFIDYGSLDIWKSTVSTESYLYIRKTIDGWDMIAPGGNAENDFVIIASLNGDYETPIGIWSNMDEGLQEVETECGSVETYCSLIEAESFGNINATFYPVYNTDGIKQSGYFSFFGFMVFWDSKWSFSFSTEEDDIIAAEIPGTPDEFPIGNWTILDPIIDSFTTFGSPCNCVLEDGFTLLLGAVSEGATSSSYIYLSPIGETFYGPGITASVTVESSGGTGPFYIVFDSSIIAQTDSLTDSWVIEESSPFTIIESLCGAIPATRVCLSIDDTGGTVSSSLFRLEIDPGFLSYSNFSYVSEGNYNLSFNFNTNEWTISIIDPATVVATYPGTSTDPFSGLIGFTGSTYSISLSEGYCPLIP